MKWNILKSSNYLLRKIDEAYVLQYDELLPDEYYDEEDNLIERKVIKLFS
jgi:hypothetical protein